MRDSKDVKTKLKKLKTIEIQQGSLLFLVIQS